MSILFLGSVDARLERGEG